MVREQGKIVYKERVLLLEKKNMYKNSLAIQVGKSYSLYLTHKICYGGLLKSSVHYMSKLGAH